MPRLDAQASELLKSLEKQHRLIWVKGWRPYDKIEKEIASCDALLAIVDATWRSSTWMAIEASAALGEAAFTGNRQPPIPVLLYPVDRPSAEKKAFPFDRSGAYVLDRDVSRATAQVNAAVKREPA